MIFTCSKCEKKEEAEDTPEKWLPHYPKDWSPKDPEPKAWEWEHLCNTCSVIKADPNCYKKAFEMFMKMNENNEL